MLLIFSPDMREKDLFGWDCDYFPISLLSLITPVSVGILYMQCQFIHLSLPLRAEVEPDGLLLWSLFGKLFTRQYDFRLTSFK